MADIIVRVMAAHLSSIAGAYDVDYHYSTTDGDHGTATATVYADRASPAAQNQDIKDAARTYCAARFGTTAGSDFMAVGVPGTRFFYPKRSDTQEVVSSTVLVDDDALQAVIPANVYGHGILRAWFETSSAGDFKYRLAYVATGSNVFRRILRGAGGATPAEQAIVTAFDTADVALTGTGQYGLIFEDFTFASGLGATLKLQWAQNSSNATPTKILRSSYLELEYRP
jgi:hypothetical protein